MERDGPAPRGGEKTLKKKSRRYEIPAGAVYALVAVISLICVTVMAVAIGTDWDRDEKEEIVEDEKEPFVKTPHLRIENVFFRSMETENIQVDLTVYITNDGTKAAENVKVHAWPVVDESNLATDKMDLSFGVIDVNKTEDKHDSMVLEAGHVHSVDLLVFESNMLVLKGRATVSTEGVGGTDYQDTDVRGGAGDSDYDGIPDSWEIRYGLDPEDPRDADRDMDGDGFSNFEEYKLNRDPGRGYDDTEPCDGDDDDSPLSGLKMKEEEDGAAIVGAFVVLLFMGGIILVLVFAAVWSHRRSGKGDFNSSDPEPGEEPAEYESEETDEEVDISPFSELPGTKEENNREEVEGGED